MYRGYNCGSSGALQVVWESQLSTADEAAMQDALLQRLAEREVGYYGKPGLSRPGAITKGAAPGMVSPCPPSCIVSSIRIHRNST